MAYIFGLKQATKMGLSLLHSPLTVTFIRVNNYVFWYWSVLADTNTVSTN